MYRILIVEDNKDHRRLLRDILRDMGNDVIETSTTTEAEGVLEREAIDLIVLDHGLPNIRGGDWYYEYLQMQPDRIRDLPVVLLTVFGMNPEIKDLSREKRVRVIPKPMETKDLIDAVRKLLSG
jgi:two-component system OmpR family response regulator